MIIFAVIEEILFCDFHISQKAINGTSLQSTFILLHHWKASLIEENVIQFEPKCSARLLHIHRECGQIRKMWKLLSSFDLHNGQIVDPLQFLFWRLSHVRFLLWKTSQVNKIIFVEQPAFQKVMGKCYCESQNWPNVVGNIFPWQ